MVRISETRKVQRFGRSTLMVSLPSEWVKDVGLKPGDLVRIETREDGSLLVIPYTMLEKKTKGKEVKIIISHSTPEEILTRSIYATYIAGYDRIVVESAEHYILTQQMQGIRTVVRMLIGAEIVEQSANRVVIQVFVDTERYSLDNLVLRMLNSIKSMFDFLMISIKNRSTEHLKEVLELEYELDRVHALAVRYTYVLNLLGGAPFLTEYRTLIKSLEDIGDSLAYAAQVFLDKPELMEVISYAIRDKLDELKEILFYTMDIVYEALMKGDVFIASRAVDLSLETSRFISKLETEIIPKYRSLEEYIKAKSFFEKLALVCNHLQATAELTFDIVLGKAGHLINLATKSSTYTLDQQP